MLERRSQEIGQVTKSCDELKTRWFSRQRKPPSRDKLMPEVRQRIRIAAGSEASYRSYAFRTFVSMQLLSITHHILDKYFQMVRYYGWYSNRSRGERNKADLSGTEDQPSPSSSQATVLDVSDYKPRHIPSKTWRELIKKIWEVDHLSCPRCGHEMKIISLINDPDVIERILRHLGLWKQQTAPSERETKAPEHGPVVIEYFDDGWPGYEEPVIVYH
jgi:hypothetical protein